MGPLYIKTDNSLLNSLVKIDDLIDFALKNNITSLAITDDSMYGCLEFYMKCKKNNIKPIIGLEINNIVLYAINYNGYKNLIKLSTISSKENVEIKTLMKYSDDLICIVPYNYLSNYDNYKFYKYLYKGYTNLDEKRSLNGKLVYLNEVLYLEEKDKEYLKYLYAIKKGTSINEVNLNKHDNHLLNYRLYVDDCNEEIIELCNLELPLKQDLLPIYNCPDNLDSYSYLKKLVVEGLKKIFGDRVNKVYLDRLKYELNIINKMGFCNYFLIVWDYVKYAKENDILVGPGRGSAAGSLVAYCLGITTIDPIKYNLLFERFLNPERISMPDIDIDFEYTKRDEIINYCIKKYGNKRVAPIITFGTLGSKQVIRDVGKTLNIDSKLVDNFVKKIDPRLNLHDNYSKIKNYLADELKKIYKISLKLEGIKRHTSIHAAGVVMSKYDLDEIIPLTYHDNFYITSYSMEYLEDIGLLKMDFLALKNLTLINNILKEINLNFDKIPLNDKKAIDVFNKADTIGIFQFESSGMINFISKFKINNFDDIVAAVALFRPGPMNNIDSYIKRKNNLESIDYITDSLIPILKSTYGIIIYQEQIMQIANVMANYSLAEADLLRKAMSKKKEEILLKEKDKFIKQSISNGYNKDIATKIYELILKFASYGFNKAHSVSYAMIAYKMAYLKANYYKVFMKNLLSMVIGSEVKTREYINICKVNVLKPDINISELDYIIYEENIIFPLTNIKSIGNSIASSIINERKKSKYNDIFDFVARNKLGKSTLEVLNKAGCFEKFINQKTFDNNIDLIVNYSELGSLLEENLKPELINMHEYDKQELLKREIEVFGTYLSGHPVLVFKNKYKSINLDEISKYYNKIVVSIIFVEKVKKVKTKNNKDMFFITGSDETNNLEFILFSSQNCDIIIGSIYIVEGRVEKRFDKFQIIINRMKRLENER